MARGGDVGPQQDGMPFGARRALISMMRPSARGMSRGAQARWPQLAQSRGDEGVGAARQRGGRDLRSAPAGSDLFIGFADQASDAAAGLRKDVIEMGVGVDQPARRRRRW